MSGFLDQLELELLAAAERQASMQSVGVDTPRPRRAIGRQVRISARLAIAVAAVLLLLAAAALAAAGVLFTGSAVPPTPHLSKHAGIGLPETGHARLVLRSAPDPAGGPPWGMRIVQTTRGLVCLQIGRLYGGRIGILGVDGAFHDDGLFHPLRLSTLEAMPRDYATACEPRGETFSEEVIGMPRSGQLPSLGTIGQPSQERRLYYGLLGPNAVSITYRAGAVTRTVPVEAGTGAYLIVLPGARRSRGAVESGMSKGAAWRNQGRLRAVAPLLRITYRVHGKLCVEAGLRPVTSDACPRESASRLMRRVRDLEHPEDLHVPIHVKLRAMPNGWWRVYTNKSGSPMAPPRGAVRGVYYRVSIAFKAPFGVRDAGSGYTVEIAGHGIQGGAAETIDRDISKGSVVLARDENVFGNSFGRPVVVKVFYDNQQASRHRSVLVGSTTIRRP